jgi:hypothetical protein
VVCAGHYLKLATRQLARTDDDVDELGSIRSGAASTDEEDNNTDDVKGKERREDVL